jgi:hypothetical protein
MNSATVFLCLAIVVGAIRCSTQMLTGGNSSSETTNGFVVGSLVKTDGSPAEYTIVKLLPDRYDPVKDGPVPDSLTDTSDVKGTFQFRVSGEGMFNIEGVRPKTGERVLITGVEVGKTDTVTVARHMVQNPGSIKILLPAGINTVNGYLYIPGSFIFAYLKNSQGAIVVDSVPADVSVDVAFSATNSPQASLLRGAIRVPSRDTAIVWNPAWPHARTMFLNTAASGAGISKTLTGFPVLVRLTAGNFDFTQARNNGEDIRFTKRDNTFLPYEIERWDPVAELAEVWVKVDTVRGNDSAQSIIMYWGNADAAPQTNPSAVFDSSGGFEGVWHLNETSGARAADASHNGFTGTYKGGLPRGESGPLGICQNIMRPDTDYVDMGNVLNPGVKNFSIGVWLKRRALGTQQAFIAKTNGNAPSAAYGYLFNFDSDNLPHLYMATGSGSWGGDSTFDVKTDLAIADSTTWHYVFVVIDRSDNALCKMYVDGIDRTGHIGGNITHISAVSNALCLHIGTESDHNCSFSGSLGEVTVAFAVRSADWVKLCYMNQKAQDELIGFK